MLTTHEHELKLMPLSVSSQIRRPDGSVGMALVLPALTDCRWWFETLPVHSGVSSATRRKATGADHKKISVLSDQLVQKASMDRVVTMNRCAGKSWRSQCQTPPCQEAGRDGTRKASQTSETKFPVAIAHAMPTPNCIGEENKFLQRD